MRDLQRQADAARAKGAAAEREGSTEATRLIRAGEQAAQQQLKAARDEGAVITGAADREAGSIEAEARALTDEASGALKTLQQSEARIESIVELDVEQQKSAQERLDAISFFDFKARGAASEELKAIKQEVRMLKEELGEVQKAENGAEKKAQAAVASEAKQREAAAKIRAEAAKKAASLMVPAEKKAETARAEAKRAADKITEAAARAAKPFYKQADALQAKADRAAQNL